MSNLRHVLIPAVALVAGVGFGAAVGTTGHASATPATTVTVTSAPRTVTKTVTTNTVPQVCLDALDEADQGFDLASTAFGQYGKAIRSFINGDYAGAQSSLTDVSGTTDQVNTLADSYNPDKAACRAAAQ